MNKKPYFNITIAEDKVPHLCQILAGFQLLKDKNIIDFSYTEDSKYIRSKYLHTAIVEVLHDNKFYAYDMGDGYQSLHNLTDFDNLLDKVEIYFKRSSTNSINQKLTNGRKIIPLSFNYYVSTKNNPFDNKFPPYHFKGIKNTLLYIRNYINHINQHRKVNYKNFERSITQNSKKECKILFQTRLWDGSDINQAWMLNVYPKLSPEEALHMATKWRSEIEMATVQRIQIIRILKSEFKHLFIGGIQNSTFANKIVPDLILSNKESDKFHFMKLLKNENICIATKGLHNSIGWKFGEYVAAHKAIVSDKLIYDVPGNFRKNINYLEFDTNEKLINNVNLLLNNKDIRLQMELANFEYYHKNVRPDKLVLNSLKHFISI